MIDLGLFSNIDLVNPPGPAPISIIQKFLIGSIELVILFKIFSSNIKFWPNFRFGFI
jgi:hypothetical protein